MPPSSYATELTLSGRREHVERPELEQEGKLALVVACVVGEGELVGEQVLELDERVAVGVE
jgi:hypothetical protein